MYNAKFPIYKEEYWECPICQWLNPYARTIISSYPLKILYACKHCDYLYLYIPNGKGEKFNQDYPNGKPK